MPIFSDRQQQLFEILQSRQRISTEEIKKHFNISSATASRDIHALVMSGVANKVSHGVRLAVQNEIPLQEQKCAYCGGTAKDRTAFIIQLSDGCQRTACCCHCGLMALEQCGAQMALARDFFYGRSINARQATYLIGSSVSLCCEPSVLCFSSREEAGNFQKGFGGELHTLETAIQKLKNLMSL